MYTCTKCQVTQPITEFYIDKRSNTPMWGCKTCRRAYEQRPDQQEKKRARLKAARLRDPDYDRRHALARFSLTVEDYEAILADQGGVCAICDRPPGRKRLHVDHDHTCHPYGEACRNCVRGLLCYPCNRYLGSIKDDPTRLVDYLQRPRPLV